MRNCSHSSWIEFHLGEKGHSCPVTYIIRNSSEGTDHILVSVMWTVQEGKDYMVSVFDYSMSQRVITRLDWTSRSFRLIHENSTSNFQKWWARLEGILPNIIHRDQVGFIKNRSSTDNMRRLLHLMWMNQSNLDPIAALSLDAEKTFNGVEWEFLFVTWDKFGFGPGFVKWVKILYSNPKATVISNAITSSFFFFKSI